MDPVKTANQGQPENPEFAPYRRMLERVPRVAGLPAEAPAFLAGYEPRVALSDAELESLVAIPAKGRRGGDNVIRLRYYRLGAVAAVLTLVTSVAFFSTRQDRLKAAVVYAGGNVVVMQPAPAITAAESLWAGEDLNSGSILSAGAVVMTGPGSGADIALAEGVVLRLKENTRVKVERLAKKRDGGRDFQIFVQEGRLLAVADGLNRTDEFRIVTPDAFAEVRQTAFRISTDERGTIVHVLRGGMEIRSRAVDARPAILEADQVAQVQATDERPLLAAAPDQLFMDTRDSYELSRRITNLQPGSLADLGVGTRDTVASRTASPAPSMTNEVEFKDGSSVRGNIIGQAGRSLFLQTGGRSISLNVSDIKGIHYLAEDAHPPLY